MNKSNYIDTHCHLNLVLEKLKNENLESLLAKIKAAGVEKVMTISAHPDDFEFVCETCEKQDSVFGALGVHPHEAKIVEQKHYQFIEDHLNDKNIAALGEIGLDYYYDYSEHDVQKAVFRKMLRIADKRNKPVVIHTREAEADTIEILKDGFQGLSGVIHCFTSSLALAEFVVKECPNMMIGFTGVISFKNAQNVRDVVDYVPMDRILIETDSPFMAPVPFRGKVCTPEYIPVIVSQIAKIKNVAEEEVVKVTNANAEVFFGEVAC